MCPSGAGWCDSWQQDVGRYVEQRLARQHAWVVEHEAAAAGGGACEQTFDVQAVRVGKGAVRCRHRHHAAAAFGHQPCGGTADLAETFDGHATRGPRQSLSRHQHIGRRQARTRRMVTRPAGSPVARPHREADRLHHCPDVAGVGAEIRVRNVAPLAQQWFSRSRKRLEPQAPLVRRCIGIPNHPGLRATLWQAEQTVLQGHGPCGVPHLVFAQTGHETQATSCASVDDGVDGNESKQAGAGVDAVGDGGGGRPMGDGEGGGEGRRAWRRPSWIRHQPVPTRTCSRRERPLRSAGQSSRRRSSSTRTRAPAPPGTSRRPVRPRRFPRTRRGPHR